jgi:[ribosomal protein S18]-alanine N-acetyltransferase
MIKIQKFATGNAVQDTVQQQVVDFLYTSLEEYGDEKKEINKAIDFALNKNGNTGGIVLVAYDADAIVGAVVLNETGMGGYIPENILVYIATDPAQRGKGIGKKLLQAAIDSTSGDIALHVEPENPAKKLYEKLGFTNKYLEMRLKK